MNYKVGEYIAFEGSDGKYVVIWIGQVSRVFATNYEVHFMDPVSGDYGGCWEFCSEEDDNENPWITKVGRDSVICRVDWTACDTCVLHMGDQQWDAIESIFNQISDTF